MESSTCHSCGEPLPSATLFCDSCGAMAAPAPPSRYISPNSLLTLAPAGASYRSAAASAEAHYPPEPEGESLESLYEGYEDPHKEIKHFPWWISALSAVMVALLFAAVWWWGRGADVHVTISSAIEKATFDGAPLALTNGEAFLPRVKRGPHTLVVTPIGGKLISAGALTRAVDVGFFETHEDVVVSLPEPSLPPAPVPVQAAVPRVATATPHAAAPATKAKKHNKKHR